MKLLCHCGVPTSFVTPHGFSRSLHRGNKKKSNESVMNQHLLGRMCYAILILISLLTSLCTASDMDGLVSIHDERLNQSGNDVTTLTISLDYGAVKTACIIIMVTVMLWLLVKGRKPIKEKAARRANVNPSGDVPSAAARGSDVAHERNAVTTAATTASTYGHTFNGGVGSFIDARGNGNTFNIGEQRRQPIPINMLQQAEQISSDAAAWRQYASQP
jgi:hypothetical protein